MKEEEKIKRRAKGTAIDLQVMSYNVLSDSNSSQFRTYLYKNRDAKFMEWRYRRQILVEEIASLRPDILCLQVNIYNIVP